MCNLPARHPAPHHNQSAASCEPPLSWRAHPAGSVLPACTAHQQRAVHRIQRWFEGDNSLTSGDLRASVLRGEIEEIIFSDKSAALFCWFRGSGINCLNMGCLNTPFGVHVLDGGSEDYASKPSRGAIACMINSEISAVLAVMRRYMEDDDHLEHSLIQPLKELRKQIFLWQPQWHTINPIMYLHPFLNVIQSDETGVALSSISRLLALGLLDLQTVGVQDAMHLVVDTVTSCRFECEEVLLMKILQVLLACMKCSTSIKLSNKHVCNIVYTCFRIAHRGSSKGELLQRIARHTVYELIRCIFLHLHDIDCSEDAHDTGGISFISTKTGTGDGGHVIGRKHQENGNMSSEHAAEPSTTVSPTDSLSMPVGEAGENVVSVNEGMDVMMQPYGIPCMVDIFQFLCSLLNTVESIEINHRSNTKSYDEDVPLFALGLINLAIELGGHSIKRHPKLLALIQNELFCNLMKFGLSPNPLILSMVCNVVLNLYHHLRTELKLQLEAFLSCVLLRVAQSQQGSSYEQQQVAMEALVDLCRQPTFTAEMYANYDCDVSCSNVFEELASLLSKSAFPVNVPLSFMQVLAINGLIAMVQGMAERAERVSNELPTGEDDVIGSEAWKAFWIERCENYSDPRRWIPFVRKKKYMKRKLMICADHFNQDPKKGLEFLQRMNLSLDKLDPISVANFLRYTIGLDKTLVGDFLGNHDEFCNRVLHEFAKTFDFQDMNLETALRMFLETFHPHGESQKIERALEAFAKRYYEQSPQILINQDAALMLSFSIIILNTDQHKAQVKKKMSEDEFIRNNRGINSGNDLPRELQSELYRSICENGIRMSPEQGSGFEGMTASRWSGLLHRARKNSSPYIVCDGAVGHLDCDMFSILSGPAIAAICVIFYNAEHENVLQTCTEGFLAIAKISSCYHLHEILDYLVVSLCKFTTLLSPSSIEDTVLAIGDDVKARMATMTIFSIANKHGDYIRSGWKNILECILTLQKLRLLHDHLTSDAVNNSDSSSELDCSRPAMNSLSAAHLSSTATPRRSSSLMCRFSQLLSFDMEDTRLQPTEDELAARQRALQTIQNCNIDGIFTESKFLQADSLLHLLRALIVVAGRPIKGNYGHSEEVEDTSAFRMELLIVIMLNNRDRILLFWKDVFEHISSIVQSIMMPCPLVEKAVFGLLRICQRLLPYTENLSDELLRSLQLILKLDARVADVYCEHITQEVICLLKANVMHIRSVVGWRVIISLLSVTALHPEASEPGFEALTFIMSDGAHLLPANYALCIDASTQFAESWVGFIDRSVCALDLMAESIACLVRWSHETRECMEEENAVHLREDIGEMWLRLVQGLKKMCLDQRIEVRNHALLMLQRCLLVANEICFPRALWDQCFCSVVFKLLDDLLEIARAKTSKHYRNMEGMIVLAMKLMTKVFLQFLDDLSWLSSFRDLWAGVLGRIEQCLKVKFRGWQSEKVHELVPELLKNTLLVMKSSAVLASMDGTGSFWELTWLLVKNIDPSLHSAVFPDHELGDG